MITLICLKVKAQVLIYFPKSHSLSEALFISNNLKLFIQWNILNNRCSSHKIIFIHQDIGKKSKCIKIYNLSKRLIFNLFKSLIFNQCKNLISSLLNLTLYNKCSKLKPKKLTQCLGVNKTLDSMVQVGSNERIIHSQTNLVE